ncbi:MAG: MBL fold metallo-hydrolase [Leptolyngbyaceae cyanobacterium MO_188.B28]|nr:MBL fold metallo-hydrolase [Leptolyngbyaceae cyanobacterium MO_188.B28]
MDSTEQSKTPPKAPRRVFDTIFAFPPNRHTLGATAYLILENDSPDQASNILIDCPAWEESTHQFLQDHGGVRWLFLTHRGGIGQVAKIQDALGCEVVIQEQEAYLIPEISVTSFQYEFVFSPTSRAFWTPGHSPGCACLHHSEYGGVLFTGRHLLPTREGQPAPLRVSKTFHWPRQLRSVKRLLDDFNSETLSYLCPGANSGFLRGKRAIANAYEQLQQLDLDAYEHAKPLL